MSKIHVLPVLVTDGKSVPVTTKKGLTNLIKTSPELVKIVPVAPSPGLVAAVPAYDLPVGSVFVAHGQNGKRAAWSAEITRTENHVLTIR